MRRPIIPVGQHRRPNAPRRTALQRLRVVAIPGERWRGRLIAGTWVVPCVLGPAGMTRAKREGDGATPAGRYRFEALFFRADRGPRPVSPLPSRPLRADQGWCDDGDSPCYNRAVALPFGARHERLWRDDRLYDLLVVVDFNRTPVRKAHGSAIFLHVRRSPAAPTAGCIAVEPAVLRKLVMRLDRRTSLVIG